MIGSVPHPTLCTLLFPSMCLSNTSPALGVASCFFIAAHSMVWICHYLFKQFLLMDICVAYSLFLFPFPFYSWGSCDSEGAVICGNSQSSVGKCLDIA